MLQTTNQIILCFLLFFFSMIGFAEDQFSSLVKQREDYTLARKLFDKGNIEEYQRVKAGLSAYPLLPYLEYQELNKLLYSMPYSQVDEFIDKYKDTYIGDLLLRNWLSVLATKERWHEYRSYFSENLSSTSHQCLLLWARFKTGENAALKEADKLWNVGRSQPDSCDPLFKQWIQSGNLTQDLIWERFVKVSLRNNTSLSRYLKQLMNQKNRTLAELFQKTIRNPRLLENENHYKKTNKYKKSIVYHGLKRYVRLNSDKALELWNSYNNSYKFSQFQENKFRYSLARRHAFDGLPLKAKKQISFLTEAQQQTIIEIVIRHHLKNKDWRAVDNWIALLPPELQNSERWQYWRARSYAALNKSEENYLPIYKSLSQTRNFYGFLSADYLNQEYNLQHSPTITEQSARDYLENLPGIARARELFFLDKMGEARQEWNYAINRSNTKLDAKQYETVAQMAYDWGWYRKSIESMAAAASWDDLTIRFPIAHSNIIKTQARKTNLPANLVFAIARQESAWESDAKSSAGALGLMQIMPKTAKETAKKAGIAHRHSDLLKPDHNITLGSRYISELLDTFDNNRVPAIAAYNAGPHRVNQWLARTDSQLPYDIWIEVIPFGETRKYVQNVLTYAVVYSHQMGKMSPLLTQNEINRDL